MALPPLVRNDAFGSSLREGPDRDQLLLNMNQTASFIPNGYLGRKDDEKGAENPGWRRKSVEQLYQRPQIVDQDKEILALSDEVSCHCEMRIQLFYQQLCLCFD